MKLFLKIYDKHLSKDCPPGKAAKQLICFSRAEHGWGEELGGESCRQCWLECLKRAIKEDL